MKRWIIITLVILLFGALAVRAIFKKVHSLEDETSWYVTGLKYEFTAEIDSVRLFNERGAGLLIFHVTAGDLDRSVENRLDRKLKHHGNMRFLRGTNIEQRIFSRLTGKCHAGDSMRVSSAENSIRIFRKGKKIAQSKMSESVNGRPF